MNLKVNFIVIIVFIMVIFTAVYAGIQRKTRVITDLELKQVSQQHQTIPVSSTANTLHPKPLTNQVQLHSLPPSHGKSSGTNTEGATPRSNTEFSNQQIPVDKLRQLQEERRLQLVTELNGRLNQEIPDANWQQDLESRAQNALEMFPQLSGVTLTYTQCGQTLCRLTLTAPDKTGLQRLRDLNSGIGLLLDSESWVYTDPNQLSTQVYLSRAGASLPKI